MIKYYQDTKTGIIGVINEDEDESSGTVKLLIFRFYMKLLAYAYVKGDPMEHLKVIISMLTHPEISKLTMYKKFRRKNLILLTPDVD